MQEIDEEIHRIKAEDQERMSYMFFAERISEERQEAMQEGRADERMANLRQLIAKLKLTIEQAMDVLDIPMSERQHYRDMLQTAR